MATDSSDPGLAERQILENRTATDKVSGLAHSLRKFVFGVEGSRTFVSNADPFPVTVAGGTSVVSKFARINVASTSAVELVVAVPSKKLRVLSVWALYVSASYDFFSFFSNTTEITGPYFAPYSTSIGTFPLILPYDANGHFETVAGEALKIKSNTSTLIGGHLVYAEI